MKLLRWATLAVAALALLLLYRYVLYELISLLVFVWPPPPGAPPRVTLEHTHGLMSGALLVALLLAPLGRGGVARVWALAATAGVLLLLYPGFWPSFFGGLAAGYVMILAAVPLARAVWLRAGPVRVA